MRNAVVIDANIALKWVLNEADSDAAVALFIEWKTKETAILAPALLMYEVANILYREAQVGRISFESAKNGLYLILAAAMLDFSQDSLLSIRAMELASRFGLPASYDTHYLALAEREGCTLWTADTRMWKATNGSLDWIRCLTNYSTY